jgi:hypothetical protein
MEGHSDKSMREMARELGETFPDDQRGNSAPRTPGELILYRPGIVKCFVSGTAILMDDFTLRPIELVRPGDRVLAFDENSRDRRSPLVSRKVLRTFVNFTREWIVLGPDAPQSKGAIQFDSLVVTPGHRFLSPEPPENAFFINCLSRPSLRAKQGKSFIIAGNQFAGTG